MKAVEPAQPIRVEPMLPADIGDGLALVAEAGWNQVAADWQIMLSIGEGFCVRDKAGRAIATGVTLPYPEGGFGWIGMVLVHAPFRKRGLATALLHRTIEALQAKNLVPMLDATPAGRKVYETLGFRAIEPISRWRGQGGAAMAPRPVPLSTEDATAFARADGAVFAHRPRLIADLLQRPDAYAIALPKGGTWLLTRAGRTATQVGPLVARDDASARDALRDTITALSGPLLLDLPDTERHLAAAIAERGFQVERSFTRMALTDGPLPLRHPDMRIIAGPELG